MLKKKKDENIWGDILNCIAMWYLKKGCLLSGVVNRMSLSVGEGRGGAGRGGVGLGPLSRLGLL